MSLCIVASLLIVGLFELGINTNSGFTTQQTTAWKLIIAFSIFAGMLNLIRELIKDLEDIQGDHQAGYKTLPILLGIHRTAQLTAILTVLCIFGSALYIFVYVETTWMLILFVLTILGPLIYVSTQLWDASKKKQFTRLSTAVKLIMGIGILLLPLLAKTIQYAS